ncbi:MAG: hypothetical protein [Wendovervirus sonii]|uniref:Uncharacterized protein n=1 Tax=phage Lak_Megaphage_Sonny TaxID=3109229 RepID=A0ABZ0Z5V0_9CAUD|nr:MAG: hypothetical protein [phage Lak_Megaphage_Sonny]
MIHPPYIEIYPELMHFLKKHKIIISTDMPYDAMYLYWLNGELHKIGYSIEVTEMSTAGTTNNTHSSNWKRLNLYRWNICYWDKDGYLKACKYSDTLNRGDLTSIDAANIDAIKYIVEYCEDLEK